jgi:hypothetical protein
MLGVRQHSPNRRRVAGQLIGDYHARFIADAVNNLLQEALSGVLITPRLHQDIQHGAVLIDSPPQPVARSADLQQNLVEVPFVARSCSSPPLPPGKGGTELGAPLADRLMADDDAPLGEQILNVAEAEVETKVQPDGVSDDLGREAIATVQRPVGSGCGDGHQPTLIADSRST